jgi:peroxiredoxin Q/BCP
MLDWFFSKPLAVGAAAPDFSIPDQDGNQVSLAALRGRNAVLVFYPGDNTPGCTKQLCDFRDSWAGVAQRNAVVFGVNPAGATRHGKFRQRYNFPFPLLVDQDQRVARLYNAYTPIAVKRTVYLIGPDGVIRFARRGMPAPSEVLAAAV